MTNSALPSPHSILVYQAADFCVVNGANFGDPISFAAELDLADTYELRPNVRQHRLSVARDGADNLSIAPDTDIGHPGAALHLDCCLTLMCRNGMTSEMLILVETDDNGDVAQIYILPLAHLSPRNEYSLIGIDVENARAKFAEVACVSFTRGTHITMASGQQKLIEDLVVGDTVITRDDGPQKIRWIGRSTVRAVGDFAPIRIRAGALHNENDLLISPDHRLFIFQRSDALGAGRNEILVRARYLVNGDSVIQQGGGFVDYIQLLFDDHQIIYAEGIAAETLLIDAHTRAALPDNITCEAANGLSGHTARPHMKFEVAKTLLDDLPDAAAILKNASSI